MVSTPRDPWGGIPRNAPIRRHPAWPHAADITDPVMLKLQDFARTIEELINSGEVASSAALARRIHRDKSTITRIIRGQLIPTATIIAEIEQACGRTLWPDHDVQRFGGPPAG